MSTKAANGSSALNTIIFNLLPDNRPITSLHVIEDLEKCPANFVAVTRTYDQDVDADLWREHGLFLGRKTARYLCVSKSEERVADHIVETVKVIGEKEAPPQGFSVLAKTVDSESKAWRKKQIAYKLTSRESVTEAITDVILCSKSKYAPQDYSAAGDINGVLVFYKKSTISQTGNGVKAGAVDLITMGLQNLNKSPLSSHPASLYPSPSGGGGDYENLKSNITPPRFPIRPAPKPPAPVPTTKNYNGTLGPNYSELDGVPFALNALLQRGHSQYSLPLNLFKRAVQNGNCRGGDQLDYDFTVERQVLCTTKAINNKNPFFQ